MQRDSIINNLCILINKLRDQWFYFLTYFFLSTNFKAISQLLIFLYIICIKNIVSLSYKFEMEQDHENVWGNIRQFRKNLNTTKALSAHNTQNISNHQRSSSQVQVPLLNISTQLNSSDKENVLSAVNLGNGNPLYHSKEEKFVYVSSDRKDTQSFLNPMSRDDELPEHSLYTTDETYRKASTGQTKSTSKTDKSLVIERRNNIMDEMTSEDADFVHNNHGDQHLINELQEVKKNQMTFYLYSFSKIRN